MAKCEWKRLQTIALCGIVEEKVRKFANFEILSKSHSPNLTFIIEFISLLGTLFSTRFLSRVTQFSECSIRFSTEFLNE
jgi:hypothetical protein